MSHWHWKVTGASHSSRYETQMHIELTCTANVNKFKSMVKRKKMPPNAGCSKLLVVKLNPKLA